MGQFQMVTFQDSIQQGAVEFRLLQHLFDAREILYSSDGGGDVRRSLATPANAGPRGFLSETQG